MPLFKVFVTREQSAEYFIEAPDYATAKEDAEELGVDETMLEDDDETHLVSDASAMTERDWEYYQGYPVWTGGPDGNWKSL